MLAILNLLQSVDPHECGKRLHLSVRQLGLYGQTTAIGKLRVQHPTQTDDLKNFLTCQTYGFEGLTRFKLQGKNSHTDQVRPMNPLETLGNHRTHTQQLYSLGSPSVITLNPATYYQFKTGHLAWIQT